MVPPRVVALLRGPEKLRGADRSSLGSYDANGRRLSVVPPHAPRLASSVSVPALEQQRRPPRRPQSRHSYGGISSNARLPAGQSGGRENAGKARRSSTGSMGNVGRRPSVQVQQAYDLSSWHCLQSTPRLVVISSRPLEEETNPHRRHSMLATPAMPEREFQGMAIGSGASAASFLCHSQEQLRPAPQAAPQQVSTSTWTAADMPIACRRSDQPMQCSQKKATCTPSEAPQCTVEEPSQGSWQKSRGEMRSASSQTMLTSASEVPEAKQVRLDDEDPLPKRHVIRNEESPPSATDTSNKRPARRSAPAGCPQSSGQPRRRRSSVKSAQSLTANLSSIMAEADLSFGDRSCTMIPPSSHGWDWPLSRQEKKARVVMLDRNMLLADQSALLEQMHDLCVEFSTTECLESPTGDAGFGSDAGSSSCL